MKKVILIFLCVIVISVVLPANARADFGPKPSVVIDFSGLDGETYYATLLSSTVSTGPYSTGRDYQEYMGNHEAFLKFSGYGDADGYYFLRFYKDCSETNRFSWTYYPPQKFKILLYFPETDTFIASNEIYERYAFDSYFTAEIEGQGGDLAIQASITLSKSYHYTNEIISLVIRILLTIAVELVVALLFGLRGKKVFRFIAVTNIVTQIALNLALNIINFHMGMLAFIFFYVLLEIAVFAIEAILYAVCLKKEVSKGKLTLYALSANVASFALGMLLAIWMPGIF